MKIKLSRSAIEEFIKCPLCFYLRRKLGLKPPAMVPLTLAVATDALLKNEFDAIRVTGENHPLWERHGLKLRAFQHTNIDTWRSNFKGMRVNHEATGVEISGAVDDIWENLETSELHIVDYKSTSKKDEPTLEGGFGEGYKRQMDIYQWLFRQAGFKVSRIGYFLYVNGLKQNRFYEKKLDGVMHFDTTLIPYESDDSWVDATIRKAVDCLDSDTVPGPGSECDSCRYFQDRQKLNWG
jgi:CRISPR/Cas system-associated exonuclease Cas4 (RecB family)